MIEPMKPLDSEGGKAARQQAAREIASLRNLESTMTAPDHDAIDAALIEAMAKSDAAFDNRGWIGMGRIDRGRYIERAARSFAVARHGLAIVPAGESAAGAARDMREAAAKIQKTIAWLESKQWGTIQYMEGSDIYQHIEDHASNLGQALAALSPSKPQEQK